MEKQKMTEMVPELKHLGKKSPFIYDNPQPSILEWVPNAFGDPERNCHAVKGTVHIEAPEFTSLCPITGQPDFGTIVIDYEPHMRCVESKSLKLYLGAYRQLGEFQENIVNRIANDLITLLSPQYLKVEGRFTPRGGIALYPSAEYRKKDMDRHESTK
jgi:7-cyano-7-deazaguanine reductase